MIEPSVAWKPRYNPWLVAVTVTLATFMEVLDSSIANVALPYMQGSLNTTLDQVSWVLTSYVIASAIISLLAHFAVGAAKSLITVRSWWSSGFEMTAVGAIEGVVTYLIGVGLGHLGA